MVPEETSSIGTIFPGVFMKMSRFWSIHIESYTPPVMPAISSPASLLR